MFRQGIEKLRVRGFKAFADASVELNNCNILIGANGAGKSALLSLLRMLRALSHEELDLFVKRAGKPMSSCGRPGRRCKAWRSSWNC
jgi:predicted ATPase